MLPMCASVAAATGTGFASARNQGTIRKSTDGGRTWASKLHVTPMGLPNSKGGSYDYSCLLPEPLADDATQGAPPQPAPASTRQRTPAPASTRQHPSAPTSRQQPAPTSQHQPVSTSQAAPASTSQHPPAVSGTHRARRHQPAPVGAFPCSPAPTVGTLPTRVLQPWRRSVL